MRRCCRYDPAVDAPGFRGQDGGAERTGLADLRDRRARSRHGPELQRELAAVRNDGAAPVLLDLSESEFIDSSGLALIIQSWRELSNEAGITLTPRVDRHARITVRQCVYSVPARLIGRRVRVLLRATEVLIFDGRRQVATHARATVRGSQTAKASWALS